MGEVDAASGLVEEFAGERGRDVGAALPDGGGAADAQQPLTVAASPSSASFVAFGSAVELFSMKEKTFQRPSAAL
ncbi:hypothetical protein, partial [Streptomyces sp. Agncl-13]|uniref:hypothetical protein n=1 Tax=Streptomyces sp. Agncl-13 TaxID=3400628 RepID=UPI003A891B78